MSYLYGWGQQFPAAQIIKVLWDYQERKDLMDAVAGQKL